MTGVPHHTAGTTQTAHLSHFRKRDNHSYYEDRPKRHPRPPPPNILSKAHVMSQYRYSDRAIRALVLARDDARVLGHGHIGTEHLLLGLIQESLGTASKLLRATGITRDQVFEAVRDGIGRGPGAPSGHIPFTPRVKKVIAFAHTSSVDDSSSHVGTEHMLIGLLREGDGAAIDILKRLSVDVGVLSQRVNTRRYS